MLTKITVVTALNAELNEVLCVASKVGQALLNADSKLYSNYVITIRSPCIAPDRDGYLEICNAARTYKNQAAILSIMVKRNKKKKRHSEAGGQKILQDEEHKLTRKQGGGKLVMQVWENSDSTKGYRFAYINPLIYSGDNGRVLGYDCAHGKHHKHHFGEYIPVEFESAEDTLEVFIKEWRAVVYEHGNN